MVKVRGKVVITTIVVIALIVGFGAVFESGLGTSVTSNPISGKGSPLVGGGVLDAEASRLLMSNGLFTTPQALLQSNPSAANTVDYFRVQSALNRKYAPHLSSSTISLLTKDANGMGSATSVYLLANLSMITRTSLVTKSSIGTKFNQLIDLAMSATPQNLTALTLLRIYEYAVAYSYLGNKAEVAAASRFISAYLPVVTKTPYGALLSLETAQLNGHPSSRLDQSVLGQAKLSLSSCQSDPAQLGYGLHILAILGRQIKLPQVCQNIYKSYLEHIDSLDPLVDAAYAIQSSTIMGIRTLISGKFDRLVLSDGAIKENPLLLGDLEHTRLAEALFGPELPVTGYNAIYAASQRYARRANAAGDYAACIVAIEIPRQIELSSNSAVSAPTKQNPLYHCAASYIDSNFPNTANYSNSLEWSALVGPWAILHQGDVNAISISPWPLATPVEKIAAVGTIFAATNSMGTSVSGKFDATWGDQAIHDILGAKIDEYGEVYYFEAGALGLETHTVSSSEASSLQLALKNDKGCPGFPTFYRVVESNPSTCSLRATLAANEVYSLLKSTRLPSKK